MTAEEADMMILTLKAAYPHADAKVDPRVILARENLYRTWMMEKNVATMGRTMKRVIGECKFFPNWAEIMEIYDAESRQAVPKRMEPLALPSEGNTMSAGNATAEAMEKCRILMEGKHEINSCCRGCGTIHGKAVWRCIACGRDSLEPLLVDRATTVVADRDKA